MKTKIDVPAPIAALVEAEGEWRAEISNRVTGAEAFFDDLFDRHTVTQIDDATAEITLYGGIGGFLGIDGRAVAKDIKALEAENITLRVDSPGGAIWPAVMIYNALVDHPASVTAVVDALAASAASFIVQAADKRIMNRGSDMMIHRPRAGLTMGLIAEDLRNVADFLDIQEDKIVDIYAARSDISADVWRDIMAGSDRWYSAKDAVAAGLADEVVDFKRSTDKNEDEPDAQASGHRNLATNVADEPTSEDAPESAPSAALAADQAAVRQRAEQVVAEARERALAALG